VALVNVLKLLIVPIPATPLPVALSALPSGLWSNPQDYIPWEMFLAWNNSLRIFSFTLALSHQENTPSPIIDKPKEHMVLSRRSFI
jgi:hypothetical protein